MPGGASVEAKVPPLPKAHECTDAAKKGKTQLVRTEEHVNEKSVYP